MSDVIPTLNRCGYQMATPSPLLQDWLTSYDGEHPLLDVGCAYGINTFKALENGIPTIALDPEEKHLEILRENADKNYSPHLLSCLLGSAPNDCKFSYNSLSGILCSEVLHFMNGNEIEICLQKFHRQLIPHGKLIITMLSDIYLGFFDKNRQIHFYNDLVNGIKWPGIVQVDDGFIAKVKNALQSNQVKAEITSVIPDFFQVCTKGQLRDELEKNGFDILNLKLSEHGGYMDKEGIAKLPGCNLQIVAEKH